MPRPIVPVIAARRRRRGNASDIAALVAALGGDASVPGFYDTRYGVTATTTVSQWDDARGAAGFGPSFTTTTGSPLGWNAGNLLITASGGSLATAASAGFALNAGATLVMVGNISIVTGQYYSGLTDALARTRSMGVKNIGGGTGTIAGMWFTGGAEQTQTTGADHGSNRRIIIVKCSGTTGSVLVPNLGVMTTAITAEGSGSNRLTVMDYFPGGTPSGNGSLRAVIVIGHATSGAEDTLLNNWAMAYHSTVAI